MYTLKTLVKRGSMFGATLALVAAVVTPATAVFADSLNPLTERSLLLSSSAPGYQNTDGSGNSFDAPDASGNNYAPAGSGPNGMRTGETFTFRVSSTATVKAFTLQYCTSAAGLCQAPGNNTGDARVPDRQANTGVGGGHEQKTSDLDFVGSFTQGVGQGQFQVYIDGTPSAETWLFAKSTREDSTHSGALTGKNNFVTLTSTTGESITNGQEVKIVFRASEAIHITNPGSNAFFVKINTFNSNTSQIGPLNDPTPNDTSDHTIIDGGVTVANVMTDSIHITTKVLETMAFSVGTQNPDTQNAPSHGICDAISVNNRLNLGDPNAEFSLKTDTAYDTQSYWRLSSNSSGGATVYYSGNTLANTVGDEIAPIGATLGTPNGSKDYSHPGTEQFGLALIDAGVDPVGTGTFDPNWATPNIAPLNIEADYADGAGGINEATWTNNAQFAFNKASLTTPQIIAQNNDQVVSCATSKVRYVVNIAANTPAGVYTTKINFLAAPQY